MNKFSAFLTASIFTLIGFSLLHAAPEIGKAAIEAGFIEAPSNYNIYK